VETTISLADGEFAGTGQALVINGPDIKAENTFQQPYRVRTSERVLSTERQAFTYAFEPHSITALICAL
jgi:alpha-L-arabinofuranosidase